jgi:quercetin dioxygenase-like cupin family protein
LTTAKDGAADVGGNRGEGFSPPAVFCLRLSIMKNINLLENFDLGRVASGEKGQEVRKVYEGPRRQILSIKLRGDAVLAKHKAAEPITVFCLAGSGTFRAGTNLEEAQKLAAGTLITLEPEIEHEVTAEPDIHILVTKFRQD